MATIYTLTLYLKPCRKEWPGSAANTPGLRCEADEEIAPTLTDLYPNRAYSANEKFSDPALRRSSSAFFKIALARLCLSRHAATGSRREGELRQLWPGMAIWTSARSCRDAAHGQMQAYVRCPPVFRRPGRLAPDRAPADFSLSIPARRSVATRPYALAATGKERKKNYEMRVRRLAYLVENMGFVCSPGKGSKSVPSTFE